VTIDFKPGEGTRGRILEELATAPRTARDLAKALGIQESAARGHLERLEGRGLVVPTFRREGVGRPRKRFLLTPEGHELFPRKYELLLESVLEELLASSGKEFVRGLFAESAKRMADHIARALPSGTASPKQRAELLADALNQLGFRCSVEAKKDGSLRIVRTNCIFRHSALGHADLICDVFDKNLTEALLGQVGIDLEASIGRGASQCTHLIQLR
jgi:predicted ArsR family transcriptional regulator